MPRAFTAEEKARIRTALLVAGSEQFATFGVRKTNIADLCAAAGISKGAFYLFFESKEDLFFELLEQFETAFRRQLLAAAAQPQENPKESFKQMLRESLDLLETHPLLRAIAGDELPYLLRRVSPERLAANFQGDSRAVAELLSYYRAHGTMQDENPEVIAGLLRALFFVRMHRAEVGEAVFPAVMEMLIDMTADRLVGE